MMTMKKLKELPFNLSEVCRETGLNYPAIRERMKRGAELTLQESMVLTNYINKICKLVQEN